MVDRTHDIGTWMELKTREFPNPRAFHFFFETTKYGNKKWERKGKKEKGNEGRYRRGEINGKIEKGGRFQKRELISIVIPTVQVIFKKLCIS